MVDIQDIMSGWKNYLFPSEDIKVKARERAKICSTCSYSSKGIKGIPYPHCTICGCHIPAKVSSKKTKGCPKGLWN